MRASAQGRAAPGELVSALVDDVESKKHRRDPFGDRYVALATSEFGGNAQDGGRAAVEAATTNVHVRVELIRSMKNALVKQTQEAVKRSTQLGAPPSRPRLGTRARQAAAADAAAAEAERAGEEDANSEAAFFCDDLHQELEQLLSGGGLAPDTAASLAAAQALAGGRDATRLPPGDLSLHVEGELAPPPFDALVQQLFGADASQDTAAAAAPLPPDEAAGLAAAVSALQLHTAELEARGALQVAGAPAEHWLLPDGSSGAADDVDFAALPPYLQAAPLAGAGGGQPFFQAQRQRQPQPQQGPDERYQHWPTHAAGVAAAAAAESHDAIQEADEGPAWGALEGEAFAPRHHPALQLNLQPQRQAGPAAGGVLVTFDDELQPQQQRPQHAWQQPGQNQWQAGGQPWQAHRAGPQQAQQGQATLSDIWEGGDGGGDPWMEVEDGGSNPQWQQEQQQWQPGHQAPAGALRVPMFAPRPGRQQLALSHSQPQPQQGQQAAGADEGIEDEEDWDEGMLEQVAAMEQQALAQRQQAMPGGQPSQQQQQQQQGKRHVPVFRNRAFQQQALPAGAWPAESIEDADSDEEPRPAAPAAAAGPSQAVAAAQRATAACGAVPQLGRRGALPLASQAAAAGEAMESEDEEGQQAAAAIPAQPHRPGQRAVPAATAAGTGGQPAVLVDFSAVDVEALRPSVLLRAQASGHPKWRPVFDPEQLLLQPLRSTLRPPSLPPAKRQPGGGSHWQAGAVQTGQPASHAASDFLEGITAADLAEWDDWGDEDAAAADAASFDADWDEAAGQWGADSQAQQQQRQQPLVVGWDEPAAALALGSTNAAAPAPPSALPPPPAPAASPAAPTVRFQPLLELAFDYEEEGSQAEEPQQQQQQQQAQHEHSQPVFGASQPLSQQQGGWASQGGSMGGWPPQPEAGTSDWPQGFGWRQPSQPQHRETGQVPASAGDPWAGLEQAADQLSGQEEVGGEQASPPAAVARPFQQAGEHAIEAASPAAADAADPWAALGGEVEDAAADGLGGSGGGWLSQSVDNDAESPATAVFPMAADPPADSCVGGDGSFGGWALDVEWEDAGFLASTQQGKQQRQLAAQAKAPGSTKAAVDEMAAGEAEAAAAAAAALEGALEWEYDEPEQATEAAVAGIGAGSLAARLAALGVLDPAVPAAAAAAAGKRRHEQIGAEIIQALLEERRRARVDLQPLLQQLSSRLAQALAGGSGSAPGSSGSDTEVATLSAVRQACLDGGGPGVQASVQRYLVALLTAAHQHNSGAAAAAASEAEGGAAAAPAASVAPLAAALVGRQLLLHAPGGATDIQIAAA